MRLELVIKPGVCRNVAEQQKLQSIMHKARQEQKLERNKAEEACQMSETHKLEEGDHVVKKSQHLQQLYFIRRAVMIGKILT